jgi:phage host-nuclease inhibitor protein Gam
MSNRIVKQPVRPAGTDYTRQQAERLAADMATTQTEIESLVAARDAAQLAAAEPYAPAIDLLRANLDAGLAALEAWSENNLAEFARAESVTLAGHRVGWRLGNYAAKLNAKWTWAKVLAALEAAPDEFRARWLRIKTDPNKEAMIEDRAKVADLASIGVVIVQERRFYFDPAREGQADVTLTK